MRPYTIDAIQPYIPLSHGARLDRVPASTVSRPLPVATQYRVGLLRTASPGGMRQAAQAGPSTDGIQERKLRGSVPPVPASPQRGMPRDLGSPSPVFQGQVTLRPSGMPVMHRDLG
jgi:hypothetical protein